MNDERDDRNTTLRGRVIDQKVQKMTKVRDQYNEQLQELFFLQTGANIMDFATWRRRRPNKALDNFMADNRLDDEDLTSLVAAGNGGNEAKRKKLDLESSTSQAQVQSTEPIAVATSAAASTTEERTDESRPQPVAVNPQEQMALQAKREATVLKRVAELTREGLWSVKRLPKVHEPLKRKSHWDYLIEEMQWLATDFAQERRWKKAAARRLSHAAAKQYSQKLQKEQKAEKDESSRMRRIANGIARDVRLFWSNIEKIVRYKQTSRLAEKRAKALNMHLNFIVDQTEKYSSWLAEGISAGAQTSSIAPSSGSLSRDVSVCDDENGDGEIAFSEGDSNAEDDEATIEEEEAAAPNEEILAHDKEIELLQKEADIDIEEIRRQLEAASDVNVIDEEEEEEDLAEFTVSDEMESQDDEETMEQEEKVEGDVDYERELEELQVEGEMPIEELRSKYGTLSDTVVSVASSEEEEEEEEDNEEEEETGVSGLEQLLEEETGPTQLSNVAAEAEMLQPRGYTLESTTVNTPVPFLLKHTLREYQHIGLDWLVTMHDKCLNGILADEMGLGKTIQTIALLAYLACERATWGPHLIVVPTSVILNWEIELKKWCPAFKLLTYWGSPKDRKQKRQGWTKANTFHVCITSYKLVVQDQHVFRRKKWKYFILDEAQHIKNFQSQRWQTLLNFNSQRRLLLTGTPLQNNLMELWSLMHFLMPHIFSSHQEFKEWFSNPLTGMIEGSQEYNESIVRRLHKVLRPFLLRRLKCEVEKQLPQKYEHVVKCRLSKRQRFLYDDFMSRTKTKETLASGNFLSVINILMQLRKVCNHPDLFETRPTISPFIMKEIVYYTASLVVNALEKDPLEIPDLPYLNVSLVDFEFHMDKFSSHRAHGLQTPKKLIVELTSTVFSLSPSADPPEVNSMPGSVSAAFATSPTSRSLDSPQASNDAGTAVNHVSSGRSNTYSTRASTVGSAQVDERAVQSLIMPDLVARKQKMLEDQQDYIHRLNTRRCARFPMYGIDTRAAFEIGVGDQSSGVVPKGYQACLLAMKGMSHWSDSSRLLEQLLKNPSDRTAQLDGIFQRFLMYVPPATCLPIRLHASHVAPSLMRKEAVFTAQLEKNVTDVPDLLHPVATSFQLQFPETRLIQYDCGKLQTLDMLLRDLKKNTHRVLIFTQMTRMLDILEAFLNYHGHAYLRLDGATRVDRRQQLMDRFNADKRIFCFILSTRSGGLGVNLTGADTVVFYDSDWNPTMDAQAQDRCHRIGQTRDVHIYRLISEHTVEENILKKAKQKRLLGDVAIEGGSFTTDFFKNRDIREIFVMDDDEGAEGNKEKEKEEEEEEDPPPVEEMASMTEKQLEETLANAEDEADVTAAHQAKAEQIAELAEFSETGEEHLRESVTGGAEAQLEVSKTEQELTELESQLSSVERYAVHYIEASMAEYMDWELKAAEDRVEINKKNWELSHLQALKQAEEQKEEEEEFLLTYVREDVANKVKKTRKQKKKSSVGASSTPKGESQIAAAVAPSIVAAPVEQAALAVDKPIRKNASEGRGRKRKAADTSLYDLDYRPGDDAVTVSLEGKKGRGSTRTTRSSSSSSSSSSSLKKTTSQARKEGGNKEIEVQVSSPVAPTTPLKSIRPCRVQISPIGPKLKQLAAQSISVPAVPVPVSVPVPSSSLATATPVIVPIGSSATVTTSTTTSTSQSKPLISVPGTVAMGRPLLPASSKPATVSSVPYVLLTVGPNGQAINRTILNLPPNVVLKVTSVPLGSLPATTKGPPGR